MSTEPPQPRPPEGPRPLPGARRGGNADRRQIHSGDDDNDKQDLTHSPINFSTEDVDNKSESVRGNENSHAVNADDTAATQFATASTISEQKDNEDEKVYPQRVGKHKPAVPHLQLDNSSVGKVANGQPVSNSARPVSKAIPSRGVSAPGSISARSVATAGTTRSVEWKAQQDTLERLQEQNENFTRRIEIEKRRANELERKIKISKVKLEESRKALSGRDAVSDARRRKKQLRVAEDRLDHVTKTLNKKLANNEKMKHVIDDLRRDKMQRHNILNKLKKKVLAGQDEYDQLSDRVRQHSERRDQAEKEVQVLQATIDKELNEFESQFHDVIDSNVMEAVSPIGPGNSTFPNISTMDNQEFLTQLEQNDESQTGAMSIEQETQLRHQSTRSSWENAKREVERESLTKQLDQYEAAFAQIQEETGIQTIDDMVNAFLEAEDSSFSQINIINELNREIEELEVDDAKLRNAVAQTDTHGNATDDSRRQMYVEADDLLSSLQRTTEQYETEHEDSMRQLELMKPGIHSVFQKLAAGDDKLTESLSATGVSDGNIMQFLGIIEQRVAELAQMYEITRSGQPLSALFHDERSENSCSRDDASFIAQGEVNDDHESNDSPVMTRVGGISSGRWREPVLKAPQPPSTDDLDDQLSDALMHSSGTAPSISRNQLSGRFHPNSAGADGLSEARKSAKTIFAASAGLSNNAAGMDASLSILLDPYKSRKPQTPSDIARNISPARRNTKPIRTPQQAERQRLARLLQSNVESKHEH